MNRFVMKMLFFLIGFLLPLLPVLSYASGMECYPAEILHQTDSGFSACQGAGTNISPGGCESNVNGYVEGQIIVWTGTLLQVASLCSTNGFSVGNYGVMIAEYPYSGLECLQTNYPNECSTSTEPSTCSDGLKSPLESGIDCGGNCASSCVETCPTGTVYSDPNGDNIDGKCILEVPPDNYGNCPTITDWYYYPAGGGYPAICSQVTDPFMAAYVPDETELPPVSNPWEKIFTEAVTVAPAVTVDNGDGTSTVTQDTTATASDGSSSTSTKTSIIDNSTGDTISSTISMSNITTSPDSAWSEDAKKIAESVDNLSEDVTGLESSLLTDINNGIDSGLNDAQSLVESELVSIQTEYANEKGSWISTETITDNVTGILPDPSPSCTPVSFTLANGYQPSISCYAMDKIKLLLGYLFYFLTLVYIYDHVFRQDIVKG